MIIETMIIETIITKRLEQLQRPIINRIGV